VLLLKVLLVVRDDAVRFASHGGGQDMPVAFVILHRTHEFLISRNESLRATGIGARTQASTTPMKRSILIYGWDSVVQALIHFSGYQIRKDFSAR